MSPTTYFQVTSLVNISRMLLPMTVQCLCLCLHSTLLGLHPPCAFLRLLCLSLLPRGQCHILTREAPQALCLKWQYHLPPAQASHPLSCFVFPIRFSYEFCLPPTSLSLSVHSLRAEHRGALFFFLTVMPPSPSGVPAQHTCSINTC